MKARKTQNNEDEKFSYWDYIDKNKLIAFILIVSLACLIVGAVYMQLTIPPDGEDQEDPELYHMGLMPDGHEYEYNATHVWRKGEG